MVKYILVLGAFLFFNTAIFAQWQKNDIQTSFVTKERRAKFDEYLRNVTIKGAFAYDVDEDTESDLEESCLSATQFMIRSDEVRSGINKLIAAYNKLSYSTKRAMLAAIYGLFPTEYLPEMKVLIRQEKEPKLFAIESSYILRSLDADHIIAGKRDLQSLSLKNIAGQDTIAVIDALWGYFDAHHRVANNAIPALGKLFEWQKGQAIKTVYSFQRWNRDYPGLAVVQLEDGHFARDSTGKLLVFAQLARAATNLPYFLTNGNTPQGAYKIYDIGISRNLLIGPTPNLQMVLPWEKDSIFYGQQFADAGTALLAYRQLFPPEWRHYQPMKEAYVAGHCGRNEIIAHGATIAPHYFKGFSFYPLAPTDGCLSGKEFWDENTGHLSQSDQLGLVNTFLQTPSREGMLFVINLSHAQMPVSPLEVNRIVAQYENGIPQ